MIIQPRNSLTIWSHNFYNLKNAVSQENMEWLHNQVNLKRRYQSHVALFHYCGKINKLKDQFDLLLYREYLDSGILSPLHAIFQISY